jgi:hypothetical protein
LDILLKANTLLQGKDYIELADFRALFEGPVSVARQQKVELVAARDRDFAYASKQLKTQQSLGGPNPGA